MPVSGAALILAALAAPRPAVPADAAAPDFKPLRAVARPEAAPALFATQVTAPLDVPVGDTIRIAGLAIPARIGSGGLLELDLRGSGSFTTCRSDQSIAVTLSREGVTRTLPVRLHLRKQPDGTWTVRNATPLSLQVEDEALVLVDANANGVYNEPGVDGITLRGRTYVFPLPAPEERWCTPAWEFTGLAFGPWGEEPRVSGRALAARSPAALPVLKGVIEERLKLGLTPRPEDAVFSADLQKHCVYMARNNTLTHPEDKGKTGFTPEGHEAGQRSILSAGSPADRVAAGMVQTYFHRIDVIRPDMASFGVGYEGRFGGIDGRSGRQSKVPPTFWPVLCPAPGQDGIPLEYGKEAPDATPGDASAGFPITVQFNTGELKLAGHSLRAVSGTGASAAPGRAAGGPVDCYPFDPATGAASNMTSFLRCVCLIPKDPLVPSTEYEVMMRVEVTGQPWTRTWRFTTGKAGDREERRRR